MLKKIGLMALSVSSLMAMHVAEVNINENDIEANVHFDLGQFNDTVDPDTTFIGLRYIHASEEHSSVKKIGDMAEAHFLMKHAVGSGLSFGMGIKALRTRLNSNDFSAIPLGFEAGYKIPGNTVLPMELGGMFYYSPEVLSMEDAQNYIEARAYFDVELIPRGKVTLGYRHIDTNYNQGDVDYNHAAYFGFKFAF